MRRTPLTTAPRRQPCVCVLFTFELGVDVVLVERGRAEVDEAQSAGVQLDEQVLVLQITMNHATVVHTQSHLNHLHTDTHTQQRSFQPSFRGQIPPPPEAAAKLCVKVFFLGRGNDLYTNVSQKRSFRGQ